MKKKLGIIILITIGTLITFFFQRPYEKENLANNSEQLFNLKSHWSQGNIAVLIRHTERCDRSSNMCLDGDTGITVNGMKEAINIGTVYNKLLSTHAVIYNSPIKRTMQSANFMFGERSITKNWLRKDCKKNLLDNILKYKEKGKNLILVTHSTCIDALGEKEGNKLFNMDLHKKETYGGSFFLAIDSAKKQPYVLGYLDSQSLQHIELNTLTIK